MNKIDHADHRRDVCDVHHRCNVSQSNRGGEESDDIPTNAQNTGQHDSLVAALYANLVTALQADGPFTVFAPTDAAFAAAGIDLASFDTDEENATLVDILTYHVLDRSSPRQLPTGSQ